METSKIPVSRNFQYLGSYNGRGVYFEPSTQRLFQEIDGIISSISYGGVRESKVTTTRMGGVEVKVIRLSREAATRFSESVDHKRSYH